MTTAIYSLNKKTGITCCVCCAKSLQSCPTLCDPIDCNLPGFSIHGILQANTGVGCHFLLQCVKVKNESEVAQDRKSVV